jgi:hypothetical protein
MTIALARRCPRSNRPIAAAALAGLMILAVLPLPASGGPPPFGIGDWTITGTEFLTDRALMLDGNLVIQNGGSLTISNSSLTVYCDYSGEHGITVRAGGTLRINNDSMVNSLGEWYSFNFQIENGARADFENSTFISCGARLAGISSSSDRLFVSNCSFLGAFYALTLGSSATVVGSRFVGNQYAVVVDSCSAGFQNCSFDGNSWGIWLLSSTVDFIDCDFTNNSIGVSSEVSTSRFHDCRITKNYAIGIYVWDDPLIVGPSEIQMEDCVIEGNNWGIHNVEYTVGNRLNISNCDIIDSSSYGLHWTNAGTPPIYTNLTASKGSRIVNSDCVLNGQVNVTGGGNLTLEGSELRLGGGNVGELSVDVGPGGRLSLEDGSAIRAIDVGRPYGLRCRPGSAFRMDNATLRDCGWNISAPDTSGPLLETGDVGIVSSIVDFNPAALVFNGSKGALIERSTLRGMERGLGLGSSSVALRNSTLKTVTGSSAYLTNGSLLDCLNTVLDRKSLDFEDVPSRANFSWLVDVRAVWADGRPVKGANLTIQDATGVIVNRSTTRDDGYVKGVTLMEASLSRDASMNGTPHMFNCTFGGIWNRTAVMINGSREITVVLADDQRPVINITYPSDGTSLNSGSVLLAGTARDNMGLDRIEIELDGTMRKAVFLSAGNDILEADWNASFELDDGYHYFEAAATDMSGNAALAFVSVWVDTVFPRIRIASPQEDQLVNLSLLTVSGFMEPGARVFICGSEATTDRDRFTGGITLVEGQNIITAAAVDAAGNTNSSSVTVRLDSTPPMLELRSPDDGLQTRSPTIEVFGIMEPGSDVYINGRQVAPGDEPGAFRTTISLTKAITSVRVDAVDRAGNHNVTTRKVALDTSAPLLRLRSPGEGLITNKTAIYLEGEAEAGCHLTVAGNLQKLAGAPPAHANFSVPVALNEGLNTLMVTAADAAGNTNKTVIHVTLDTVAPSLSVGFPGDGLRTINISVLVEGFTEPGVLLKVNGQVVPVGYTGSFSADVRLYTGKNTITVSAEDRAGNHVESVIGVQRVPARGESLDVQGGGPDWPFWGFIGLAAVLSCSEMFIFSRRVRGRRARVEGGG